MNYSKKETEPIPFLEDWWTSDGEYGDSVCEHNDFERGKSDEEDE